MEINKHTDFDQVFKERLHDYEVTPPENIWQGIQDQTLDVAQGRSSSSWRWWAAASVVALLSVGAYFYFASEEMPSELPTLNPSEEASKTISITPETPAVTENTTTITKITKETQPKKQASLAVNASEPSLIIGDEFVPQQVIEKSPVIIAEVNTPDNKTIIIEEMEFIFENEVTGETISSVVSFDKNDNTASNASKAGRDFFDDDAIEKITQGHENENYWKLGLEFSPEWITIPENDNNIRSFGLDLSGKYFWGNWFVESGLGLAISKDDGIYNVDYQEAQFKGSYQDVYEVGFDTSSGAPVPIYYTKLVNVYDTIDKAIVTEDKNTYAYMNIPLNIGYSRDLGNKFTLYFKGGVIASFKVYESIPTPTVDGDNTSIIKITPLYFERTPWHLQAQLNMGLDYRITDKFLFGIEPNARYYIKSLVESNNGGNPYGFGVKIGFKYIIK